MTLLKKLYGFVCGVALVASCFSAWAADVSTEQAKIAAGNWAKRSPHPLGAKIGQTVLAAKTFSDDAGNALFHVVRFKEGGFVVAAADDGIQPIIAFSDNDDLVVDAQNPLWVMLNRDLPQRRKAVKTVIAQRQLQAQAANVTTLDTHNAQWQTLLSSTSSGYTTLDASVSDLRVSPLLTTTWSQMTANGYSNGNACYNYYTPPYAAGSSANYPCGCVATACAQLMRYHQYPTQSVTVATYKIWTNSVGYTATMMGGTYAWSDMATNPASPAATLVQRQAIGKLTYDIGIVSHMSYAADGSGTYVALLASALMDNFSYANAREIMYWTSQADTFQNAIYANLDAGYPVVLGISGTNSIGQSAGHAVVGDGYGYSSGTVYTHINIGWGGAYDAWYNLPTIAVSGYDFTTVGTILFNVFSGKSGEIVSGRILDPSGAVVSGANVTVTRTSGGATVATATSNARGIYSAIVPSDSQTYTVTAVSGVATGTCSVSVVVSVSTSYNYNTRPKSSLSYSYDGTVGNRWGVNVTVKPPAPDAPAGVSASDGASTDNVTVSWTASSYATGYGVYRYTSNSSNSASLLGSVSATGYTDATATPGVLYYYWVKATNSMGSSAFSASDSGYRALSAPTGVLASESATNAVTVTWGAVTGASYYRVYRATSSGGTQTALGSWQTALTYSDTSATAGTTYYYWVAAAVDGSGTRVSGSSAYDTGLRLVSVALDVALDTTNLVWTTEGSVGWFGQTTVSYDGADAARSGGLSDGQTNGLQTTVTGPGTLSFWWAVSSESGGDSLTFSIDGTNQWSLSGATSWMQQTASLASGTHSVKWTYAKNGSVSSGSDCGWVDRVVWTATGTTTTEVSVPYVWLDMYGLVTGGNYEAAAQADADGDGFTSWQEYVAGTVPTNGLSFFQAFISLSNGVPFVTWTPDLGTVRVYTVEGKSALTNAAWLSPTNAATHFYRVKVSIE